MVYNHSMKVIDFLKEVYGYTVPILLKDIHLRGKSKQAIRKELSRASIAGEIVRKAPGVYYLAEDTDIGISTTISFEDIVEKKFIKDDFGLPGLDLDIYGYYTGLTFLNQIGISQQVPAVLDIATNKTCCKRMYCANKRLAVLRKGKIKIDRFNYRALQFFDMFYFLNKDDVEKNHELLTNYISKYLTKNDFEKYIGLYNTRTMKLIIEGGLINAFR